MTIERLRHWCGAVALCVLASSTDETPGLNADHMRLLAWRISMGAESEGHAMKNDGRIEFLQKKLEADRAALAKEMMTRARREKRETDRIQFLIGWAVLKELQTMKGDAAGNPKEAEALQTVITGILEAVASSLSEKDKSLLRAKGWL